MCGPIFFPEGEISVGIAGAGFDENPFRRLIVKALLNKWKNGSHSGKLSWEAVAENLSKYQPAVALLADGARAIYADNTRVSLALNGRTFAPPSNASR